MASKIERRDKMLAKLKALPAAVRSEIKQAMAQSADEIVAMQKRLVPVRTGALRDSIKQTWGNKPGLSSAGLAGGGAQAGDPDLTVWITAGGSREGWHARFVEFGTSAHVAGGKFAGATIPGAPAQPFFYPAWRANKRRVKARISRAITRAAKKVAASA